MEGEKTEFHELNVTRFDEDHNASMGLPTYGSYDKLQHVTRTYITPGLCLFGIIGNIVNLIVLTRVRFYKTESRNERGANTGLVALAISDMLFCVAVFPVAFTEHGQVVYPSKNFLMYYQVYGTGVVTTFILTSTWITVTLALLRYITICHPVSAASFFMTKSVKSIYVIVCIVATVLNLPGFFQYKTTELGYIDNRTLYFIDIGLMDSRSKVSQAFQWIRFTMFIAIPILVLLFSNCSLVRALHASSQMRQKYLVNKSPLRRQNRITLLLVIIALGFIFLVFPSELMDFFMDIVKLDQEKIELFLVFRVLANMLQMVNFSCNFLLYCALNVHFRTVLKDLLTCQLRHSRKRPPLSMRGSREFQEGTPLDNRTASSQKRSSSSRSRFEQTTNASFKSSVTTTTLDTALRKDIV